MSDMRFVWEGLQELKDALRRLPDELGYSAAGLVRQAGYGAAADLRSSYPVSGKPKKTGGRRLAQGVTIRDDYGRFGAVVTVQSMARHAHLWEWGTQDRRTATRPTGAMVPSQYGAPLFVPVVNRYRARLYEQQVQLLRHAGVELQVLVA